MTTLHAQPVNTNSEGFFFDDFEEFKKKCASEEYDSINTSFELEFIDGEPIDARLFNALSIKQTNLEAFLDACDNWQDDDKLKVIICVEECGYRFNLGSDTPDQFEIDLYEMNSMKELAEYFVDEGLFGDIPKHLENYIDYQAIAYDLSMDYTETIICDQRLIYRCM